MRHELLPNSMKLTQVSDRSQRRDADMTKTKGPPGLWAAVIGLGLGLLLATGLNPALAHAMPGRCDNDLAVAEDRVGANRCITELYQNGSTLHVAWDALQDWDYTEISWEIAPPGQLGGQGPVTVKAFTT
jgi:hypothetical protein